MSLNIASTKHENASSSQVVQRPPELQHLIEAQQWESAYLWLCEQYEGEIWRYLQRQWSDLDVHDIFQETFTSVWRSIHELGDIEYPRAWVFRIARCRAIDHKRREPTTAAKEAMIEVVSATFVAQQLTSPEQQLLDREVMTLLHKAIVQLSPSEQELLSLYYVQEFEQKEIAALLDCNAQTIKMRLYHMRTRLKSQLSSTHPELFTGGRR